MLLLLIPLLVAVSDARTHDLWSQRFIPNEPSSRDLSIGFSVGEDPGDDSSSVPMVNGYGDQQGDLNLGVVSDPSTGALLYNVPRLLPETPVAENWYQPAKMTVIGSPLPVNTIAYRPEDQAQRNEDITNIQQLIPGFPRQLKVHPYGNRRVGAFRLRGDRGYKILMEVPPTVQEGEKTDGVLVMEMKANLYRPVV